MISLNIIRGTAFVKMLSSSSSSLSQSTTMKSATAMLILSISYGTLQQPQTTSNDPQYQSNESQWPKLSTQRTPTMQIFSRKDLKELLLYLPTKYYYYYYTYQLLKILLVAHSLIHHIWFLTENANTAKSLDGFNSCSVDLLNQPHHQTCSFQVFLKA